MSDGKIWRIVNRITASQNLPSHGYFGHFFNQIDLVYIVKSVLILLFGLLFHTSLRMADGPFIKVGKDSLRHWILSNHSSPKYVQCQTRSIKVLNTKGWVAWRQLNDPTQIFYKCVPQVADFGIHHRWESCVTFQTLEVCTIAPPRLFLSLCVDVVLSSTHFFCRFIIIVPGKGFWQASSFLAQWGQALFLWNSQLLYTGLQHSMGHILLVEHCVFLSSCVRLKPTFEGADFGYLI